MSTTRTWTAGSWSDGTSDQTNVRNTNLVLDTGSDSENTQRVEQFLLQTNGGAYFNADVYSPDGSQVLESFKNITGPVGEWTTRQTVWLPTLGGGYEYVIDGGAGAPTYCGWRIYAPWDSQKIIQDFAAPREQSGPKSTTIDWGSEGYNPYYAAGSWTATASEEANISLSSLSLSATIPEVGYDPPSVTVTVTDADGNTRSTTATPSRQSPTLDLSTLPVSVGPTADVSLSLSASSNGATPAIHSVDLKYTVAPGEPSVSVAVVDNDQIDVEIDASTVGSTADEYAVEINRDGEGWVSPAGGPSAPSTTGTYSYRPNSDYSYETQVGIDSSFKFRTRAEANGATSGWAYTSTVTTDPIPPRNARASRPDANTIAVEWTNASDILTKTAVFYRKDTGAGYGSWDWTVEVNSATTGKGQTASLTFDTSSYGWLEPDGRYQFKLRHESTLGTNGRQDSEFVYADYGNANNVYFEDDFSSGDKTMWDSSNGGNVASSDGHGHTGISGSVTGGHYFQGTGSGGTDSTYLRKDLGDLSAETNVHVRCRFSVGSLDHPNEDFGIDWYDGSSWQRLEDKHWAYNEQGWFEIHKVVPDSWLARDNRIRVGTTTSSGMYGGDYFAVDEVIISDILDEYTKPAGATNVSASTGSGRHEIDVSWTDNLVELPETFYEIRTRVGATDTFEKINEPPTISAEAIKPNEGFHATVPRRDGEQYEIRVDALVRQCRRGNIKWYPRSQSATTTAVTKLPAPTALSIANVGTNSASLSWTINNDYGSVRVDRRPTDVSSWTTAASGLDLSTESHTLADLRDGEQYDVRVVATTEHSETEDV